MPVNVLRLLCFITLLYSCNPVPRDVRIVLDQAGKNKKELKQVIEHYSKDVADSLKLEATYFLIKNMAGHYANGGENMEKFSKVYRAIGKIPIINPKNPKDRKRLYVDLVDSLNIQPDFEKQYDAEYITASFLINNIDEAFDAWENMPWGKNYNFQLFCEYILPYGIENEERTLWRKLVRDEYGGIFDKLYYEGGTSYEAEEADLMDIRMYGRPNSASNKKVVRMSAKGKNFIEFRNIDCGFAGDKILHIRYYNGGEKAEQDLIINGNKIKRIKFPGTGHLRNPKSTRLPVVLNAKNNEILLVSVKNEISVDFIEIMASEDFLPTNDANIGLHCN